jgi:hypothetical protein
MNREQRRHPEGKLPQDERQPRQAEEIHREGPPDTESVRAKSSGHGKKTADKWNQ